MAVTLALVVLGGCTSFDAEKERAYWNRPAIEPRAQRDDDRPAALIRAEESLKPGESLATLPKPSPKPPPASQGTVSRSPPAYPLGDSAGVVIWYYYEWSARVDRTAFAAMACRLRPPGWRAAIQLGLAMEAPRREAGAAELSKNPAAFEAYLGELRRWRAIAGNPPESDYTPAACNRLEFSEDLKIADQAAARFLSQGLPGF